MRARLKRHLYGRGKPSFADTWSFSEVMRQLPDETDRYRYFVWFYDHCLTAEYRRHRRYFTTDSRGFGEDAFHAMWYKLFLEYRPQQALEIGVYRGQVISLWSMLSADIGLTLDSWGVSPLEPVGDAVSVYLRNLDYESDIRNHFSLWGLPSPNLYKGLSTDSDVQAFITTRTWDLIYIDGSHDAEVVASDVSMAREALEVGGLLVMDDASLYSVFQPPHFAFKGHPGPSGIASEPKRMEGFTLLGTCGHNRVFRRNPRSATPY